jgi:hypothetical protein
MDGWKGTLKGREDNTKRMMSLRCIRGLGAAFQAAIVSIEVNCRVAWGAKVIVDAATEHLPTLNRTGVMRLSTRYRDLLPNTLMGASTIGVVVDIIV